MTSFFFKDKLGELQEVGIQRVCIDLSLVSLVPCNEPGLEHALSNVTDNFGISLPTVLLVTFACKGPRLHDEWCNFCWQ